jgi:hypothetical protein
MALELALQVKYTQTNLAKHRHRRTSREGGSLCDAFNAIPACIKKKIRDLIQT